MQFNMAVLPGDGVGPEVTSEAIRVLQEGYRTYDIMEEGKTKVGTKEMGELIARKVGVEIR